MNQNCAIVIPIYKNKLNSDEVFSLKNSLKHLNNYNIYWLTHKNIDINYYIENFELNNFKFFDPIYFDSISGYNKLLTSIKFYEAFLNYQYILILQTDAIVLKPELDYWLNENYDYIGAPWPKGYSYNFLIKDISITEGINCTTFVGNGGLSLRNTKSCINLLNEFADIASDWQNIGHAEDLFYSFMGTISNHFKLPNIMKAANFAHDIDPKYLYALNGNKLPFGAHAWEKYDRAHWESLPGWPLA